MEGVQALNDRAAVASLMRWWQDAGVDTLVEDAPRDWLKPAPLPTETPVAVSSTPSPDLTTPGPEKREELPATLPELLAWMRESPTVPEARWGRTRILPAGDPASGLMILTDMPEPGDAEAGLLMSGELGALFDRMLGAIGRDRGSIWLSAMSTVRSVGRMPPDAATRLVEIARQQVALIAPKRLLVMGEAPTRALLGSEVAQARGELRVLNLGDVTTETVATFHPRLLNDRPAFKAQAWKDLQLLMKGL